ncbi:2-C-methyl-D-erythritol 2,4-cyclodiphosphate synthase [soil metagenome]
MRVGNGYDSHRFSEDRLLILAGVEIPDHPGLHGHSDADAISHAVTDAILGAAALGDIGHYFPPSEERWNGADSIQLLTRAVELLEEENYQVVNVDVTVITESPRLGPYVAAMRARLAEALHVAPRQISIKGKTNEGMGWIGRREGLAVHAVALIDQIVDQDVVHARELASPSE